MRAASAFAFVLVALLDEHDAGAFCFVALLERSLPRRHSHYVDYADTVGCYAKHTVVCVCMLLLLLLLLLLLRCAVLHNSAAALLCTRDGNGSGRVRCLRTRNRALFGSWLR